MESRKNIQETINYLVENNIHFAIYSLPNSSHIYLIVDENKETKTGFVIQDFDISIEENIIGNDIFLKNEQINVSRLNNVSINKKSKEKAIDDFIFFNKKEYEKYVSLVVEKCRKGELKKAVPARILKHTIPNNFDLGLYFLDLVSKHETAFVNLYYHKNCGLWIGATPELLVKEIKPNTFKTNSLAGTKVIAEKRDWTNKEKEEQQIVTDYIKDLLEKKDYVIEEITKPTSVKAGKIEHLKSTILFSSKDTFPDIAKTLHPTPAVCGLPLNTSLELVKNIEKNQRENYTGFIGLNLKNEKQFYVNLRCMRIFEKNFRVHIGAGVTKDSIPEKEWFETVNKSMTILNLL